MLNGIVDDHLLPIVPVDIKREDNEWQELSLVLDTGFDGEIALDAALLDRYSLATQPQRELLMRKETLDWYNTNKALRRPTVELLRHESSRTASLHILEEDLLGKHPFSGLLGIGLLMYHHVTVDAVKGGATTVKTNPPPTRRVMNPWNLGKRKRQQPSRENLEEYLKWCNVNVPWTNLPVKDSGGRWHTAWVKVDTGSNGGLTLPTSWVTKLNLRLPYKCQVYGPKGMIQADQGKAVIFWQGKEQQVDCIHREDDVPPLIGMELLQGNRITMDFSCCRPAAEIQRIPRRTGTIRGFFDSVGDRLRS